MNPKRMDLCAECAEAMKDSGFTLGKASSMVLVKCAACGKRRIGWAFVVTKRQKETESVSC